MREKLLAGEGNGTCDSSAWQEIRVILFRLILIIWYDDRALDFHWLGYCMVYWQYCI